MPDFMREMQAETDREHGLDEANIGDGRTHGGSRARGGNHRFSFMQQLDAVIAQA